MRTVDVFVPWSGPPPETLRSSHLAVWLRHPALGKVIWLGSDAPGGAEHVNANEPRGAQALREAFAQLVQDAEFTAAVQATMRAQLNPTVGDELAEFVENALQTPPAVVDEAKTILGLNR